MITNYLENNYLVLVGKITSDKKFSHEIYGESFYVFNLEVPRLSQTSDIIPITISERLLVNFDLTIGKEVEIEGQFRSYNSHEKTKTCLLLHAFVKELDILDSDEEAGSMNEIFLQGFLCKAPVYRKTPLGREIADVLLAVNREYGRHIEDCNIMGH